VIFCEEVERDFLVIYCCFTLFASELKSSAQTIFRENILVPASVEAEIVLRPLVHFLVSEIIN
jgi:hypothetical protein